MSELKILQKLRNPAWACKATSNEADDTIENLIALIWEVWEYGSDVAPSREMVSKRIKEAANE